jgi:hypothetical protein
MQDQSAAAFVAASQYFVQVVRMVPTSAWAGAGLGDWSLLELVGHANRAHTTLEQYLAEQRVPEPAGSDYFSDAAIAQRGRDAVAALGPSPEAAVAAASARAIALVASASSEALVWSPLGTISLASYLPSRTAELVVHGLDVVNALGPGAPTAVPVPAAPTAVPVPGAPTAVPVPGLALAESLRFVTERLVDRGAGEAALMALAGRGPLPPGVSAY